MGPVGEDIIAEPEDLKVTWPSSDQSDPLPEGRQRDPIILAILLAWSAVPGGRAPVLLELPAS